MKILKKLFNIKPKINVKIEILNCPDKEHLLKHIDRIVDYFNEKFVNDNLSNGLRCSRFSENHKGIKGITDIKVSYSDKKSKPD